MTVLPGSDYWPHMTLTWSWRVWKANPLIPIPGSHRSGLLVDTIYTVEKSNPITIGFAGSLEPGVSLSSLGRTTRMTWAADLGGKSTTIRSLDIGRGLEAEQGPGAFWTACNLLL